MKGYLIDANTREIRPIDYEYTTIRDHLPGGICIGATFPNGDVLYVDDEALLKPATVAFRVRQRPDGQPMMSNGLLTGRDDIDDTMPPAFSLAQLTDEIEWLDLDTALAWFRQKAAEPAVVSTTAGGRRHVHAHWADLLRNLEGGEGYHPRDFWKEFQE